MNLIFLQDLSGKMLYVFYVSNVSVIDQLVMEVTYFFGIWSKLIVSHVFRGFL
jgi:hypothetical protein